MPTRILDESRGDLMVFETLTVREDPGASAIALTRSLTAPRPAAGEMDLALMVGDLAQPSASVPKG